LSDNLAEREREWQVRVACGFRFFQASYETAGYRKVMQRKIEAVLAASPLDVRKGFAFPSTALQEIERLRLEPEA